MKKLLITIICLGLLIVPLFAGDVPTFVNLGFSANSAYFMFGYYGIDASTGKPYSEIFLVDTKKNDFVGNGVFRAQYSVKLEPGWNALAAFLTLYNQTAPLVKKYGVDHFAQGRLAFLAIDNASESIGYKDADGAEWQIALVKKINQTESSVSSSFSISLSISKNGAVSNYTAGNPGIVRKNVRDYIIRQIILAPDSKTIVFIIEKEESGNTGVATRYMVETYRLP